MINQKKTEANFITISKTIKLAERFESKTISA